METIKRAKCKKSPGADDITVEELEVATIGSGAKHFSDSLERYGNTKRFPRNGSTQS